MPTDESDLAAIRACAERFREAIEATDFSDSEFRLSQFPHECCGHAAALLRLYLFDQGFGLFDKAAGRWPGLREHVWLRQGDIVVDITADQFGEYLPKVIVARESPWHATWQLTPSTPPTDIAMLEWNRDFYTERFPIYPRILNNQSGSASLG
jgi:hypothetical protein